jgi:hypothetical protein
VYVDGRSPDDAWESFETYRSEYAHPLWEQYREMGTKRGHGGVDYLVLRDFVTAVKRNERPSIDVYDTALLKGLSPLTEQSIALGGSPVAVPDFTNGDWMDRDSGWGSVVQKDPVTYPMTDTLPEERR